MSLLKKILLLLLSVFLIYGAYHWDDIFTELQHSYYSLKNSNKKINFESSIDSFRFSSNSYGGIEKEVKVYLPKGYSENGDERFPVFYLLHGFPGSNSDWLINAHLQNTLDELIDTNKLPPILVVLPDGNGPIIHDSEYINATKIKQPTENFILEVVKEVDERFKTLNKRESRVIGGLSTGAYGAMNIGFHHNDIFGIIISHSGYFINNEGVTKNLLSKDEIQKGYNNPLDYLQNISLNPKSYIYLDIGEKDNKSYVEENIKMDEILSQKGIEHEFQITQGWHDWEVWKKNILFSLEFLGKHIEVNL